MECVIFFRPNAGRSRKGFRPPKARPRLSMDWWHRRIIRLSGNIPRDRCKGTPSNRFILQRRMPHSLIRSWPNGSRSATRSERESVALPGSPLTKSAQDSEDSIMLPQLENVAKVAMALRQIRGERFVFAGASILPLFLDEESPRGLRPTIDTDIAVAVTGIGEWARLCDALRDAGFRERADIKATKQVVFWLDGLRADFMPVRTRMFGTEDPWLSLGIDLAEVDELPNGVQISRVPVSIWLMAKIQAFEDRGRRDPLTSQDLEDIGTLMTGRQSLAEDVRASHPEVCRKIGETIRGWREQPELLDVLDGQAASEWRALRDCLDALASL